MMFEIEKMSRPNLYMEFLPYTELPRIVHARERPF